MTDFEINKRLAEIAGVKLYAQRGESGLCRMREGGLWEPLTYWSQLGPLVEKYNVEWGRGNFSGTSMAAVRSMGAFDDPPTILGFAEHSDLKRAICLAIIGAHEEGTT